MTGQEVAIIDEWQDDGGVDKGGSSGGGEKESGFVHVCEGRANQDLPIGWMWDFEGKRRTWFLSFQLEQLCGW